MEKDIRKVEKMIFSFSKEEIIFPSFSFLHSFIFLFFLIIFHFIFLNF